MELVVIIIFSLVIAFIVCMILRSQMKTAKIATTACDYIPQGGFRLTAQGDVYLYRTTSRRKIEKDTPPSTGGKDGSSGGR